MYLFNPDNDLALAHFGQFYTPPASAQKMAHDLALLPVWYARDEAVVTDNAADDAYLSQLKAVFPIKSRLIAFSEIKNSPQETFKPWGWNPALRKKLLDAGVREEPLPSLPDLERLREYSSRKNAVEILARLKPLNPLFCGESHFFTCLNPLKHYLASSRNDKFLKMPLSGSGKGIIRIIGPMTGKQEDWCRRVILRQGGVVAEPILDKVQDVAMEFQFSDGKAQFVAYSLFSSAVSGAYAGNELLPPHEIENRLAQRIDIEIWESLKTTLEVELTTNFPHFTGVLGVDMMICRNTDGTFSLHPCVEINMRMNMGLVAHRFRERFMHPASRGIFRIAYFKREGEASAYAGEMRKRHPIGDEKGKIGDGFVSLTVINAHTQYAAYVKIEKQ